MTPAELPLQMPRPPKPECTCLKLRECQFAVLYGDPDYEPLLLPRGGRTCTRVEGDATPRGGAHS